MKGILNTYTTTISTIIGKMMCNTRMHKQYIYVEKSTSKEQFKQRF